jgi:hypothetical protein
MRSRRRLSALLFGALSLGLAGCNGVPVSTQWKLRHFNPATADISQLRVAVRPPSWAAPTPEKTILAAKYDFDDGAPGRTLDIHLHRAGRAEDRPPLAQLAPDGRLAVYEVAPSDLGAVRSFQSEMAAAKESGRHGHGTIALGGALACRTAQIPAGPIFIDAYIHASDEIGWLPLFENEDMSARLSADEKRDEHVPVCEKSTGRAER